MLGGIGLAINPAVTKPMSNDVFSDQFLCPLEEHSSDVYGASLSWPDDDFEGNFELWYENGQPEYRGEFRECIQREGQHLYFRSDGFLHEVSTWRNGWRIGSQFLFERDEGFLREIVTLGPLGSRALTYQTKSIRETGKCTQLMIKKRGQAAIFREQSDAYPSAVEDSEFIISRYDLPKIVWQSSDAGVNLIEGLNPEYWVDDPGVLEKGCRLYSPTGDLLFQGSFSGETQPEGQQLYFWPNGNLREFAYWHRGRIVGTRACYFENGYLQKEEHYSRNGTISGTGVLVHYQADGTLTAINKYQNGTLVDDIIDPDTGDPFGTSLMLQVGKRPKE